MLVLAGFMAVVLKCGEVAAGDQPG